MTETESPASLHHRLSILAAADLLDAAAHYIDAKFGDGYARDNPALIAAYMAAASLDAAGMNQARAISDGLNGLAAAVTLGGKQRAGRPAG